MALESTEQNDLNLLIVENDIQSAKLIEQTFKPYFKKIILAENGERGFQSFRTTHPDLVITSLDMPVFGGLELISKIKKLDHHARIILISDREDKFITIQAIENGVTGIITKPIEPKRLIQTVQNQLIKIKNRKDIRAAERRIAKAESEYDKSKRILQVINQASTMFFSSGFYEGTVKSVLKLIGEAIGASRVYIYKVIIEEGKEYSSRVYEWSAPGIMPILGNLSVTKRLISTSGFGRWVEVMKKHRGYLTGFISDFNLAEKERLKDHGIKSILAIPIFVNDLWWGFIGIDDCVNEKVWTDAEITALESLANNFGAAIQKRDMDEQLIKLNIGLEKRVKERTRELEFEIAERAMAEALLKDSEEKYRLIYENATDGILLIQNGKIILVNPATVDILEELPRNLIGKVFSELVVEKDRALVEDNFRKKLKGSDTGVFHVQVILNDKKPKWLELKPTKISWYGEPAHLVFVSNITPRKQAEDELKKLNESLEKRIQEEIRQVELQQQLLMQKSKLESIGELSAGLAHEINQPLLSFSMGLENMLMSMSMENLDREYLKNKMQLLFKDVDRIKNIIEHVRTFSRDQQNIVFKPVNVHQTILDALSMTSQQLKELDIEFNFECEETDLTIHGNQYRLEQVLLNLISNARQAVVEKATDASQQGYVKFINIKCFRENEKVVISVKDNGVGISVENLPVIFNPFFTTKSDDKGTGLGLSICYGIVKEMNGEIAAKSKPGKFTEIIVHLPLLSS
jgi:PAS domain S-box-containing protein